MDVVLTDGNEEVWQGKLSSAPGQGEWVRLNGKVYVVARVMHLYSAATDTFTAHVLLASIPTNWIIAAQDIRRDALLDAAAIDPVNILNMVATWGEDGEFSTYDAMDAAVGPISKALRLYQNAIMALIEKVPVEVGDDR